MESYESSDPVSDPGVPARGLPEYHEESSMGPQRMQNTPHDLVAEIRALKAERRAAILAHNYQIPEIQDLADVVADSLQMGREATALNAPVIVRCGEQLMDEAEAIEQTEKG